MDMWSGIAAMSLGLTALPASLGHAAVQKPAEAAAEPAWKMVCPDTAAGTAANVPPPPCSLVQNLVAGEQHQRLLTVIVQRNAQAGHAMTIALPHGVLFPAGVTLQIDDAAETKLVVETSDANGAYSGMPVDAAMLAALKGGKSLKVGFTGTNGQKILVPVTLKDLGTGLADLDKKPLPAAAPTKS